MSDTKETTATFAAAVYHPATGDRMALLKFVEKQKALNIRVGGVLQEAVFDANGQMTGIDAVDVSSNRRISISRPAKNSRECGLDVSALVQTSRIIRQAITDRVDLMVVEKFGDLEQDGKGLIDDIMQTIVEDIPLLISVPESALTIWQERTGELGQVVDFSEQAFVDWWASLG